MVLFGIFLVPDYNDFHIFEEFSCIVENVEYHQTKCETSKKTPGPSRIWCWYDIIYNWNFYLLSFLLLFSIKKTNFLSMIRDTTYRELKFFIVRIWRSCPSGRKIIDAREFPCHVILIWNHRNWYGIKDNSGLM